MQDWNEELILSFYATLQIDDDCKTFRWMPDGTVYKASIAHFVELLRTPAARNDTYEDINVNSPYLKRNMECLYDVNLCDNV